MSLEKVHNTQLAPIFTQFGKNDLVTLCPIMWTQHAICPYTTYLSIDYAPIIFWILIWNYVEAILLHSQHVSRLHPSHPFLVPLIHCTLIPHLEMQNMILRSECAGWFLSSVYVWVFHGFAIVINLDVPLNK